jgi:hypothetical protein
MENALSERVDSLSIIRLWTSPEIAEHNGAPARLGRAKARPGSRSHLVGSNP